MKKIAKAAMKKTEKVLGVTCPLDCESGVGTNWSETH